jgi:hypothetical protein
MFMSTKEQADALGRVLSATGLFEAVNTAAPKSGQVAVMGRVMVPMPQWLQFFKKLKMAEAGIVGTHGEITVVQNYFLKDVPISPEYPEGKRVVFAWIVTVTSSNMVVALQNIERVHRGEGLLVAASPTRGAVAEVAASGPTMGNVQRTSRSDANGKSYIVEEQEIMLPGVTPGTERNAPKPGSKKGVTGVRG